MLTLPGLQMTRGEIFADGNALHLKEYELRDLYVGVRSGKHSQYESWDFVEGLRRLLTYLESRQCVNIEYSFVEVEY